jgi:hypothetical protein
MCNPNPKTIKENLNINPKFKTMIELNIIKSVMFILILAVRHKTKKTF